MNFENERPKLWTASFIKICFLNLFIFLSFHSFLPTFPFFVTHLGGDAMTIGIATALFSIAAIIARPFAGWLIDTKGRRCILIIGLVGLALIPLGYFVSTGIALAVILRGVHGVFHASASNSSSTLVTDIIPQKRMGEGLGMYGLSMSISTAVAPAIGLLIMNKWGFHPLFIITTVEALIAIVLAIWVKKYSYTAIKKPLKIKALLEPMALPAAITQFFFMMSFGVVEVYVAIYAQQNGLPSGGVYFSSLAVATLLTRILLGRVIDKKGEAILVYTGNIAIILGIILLVLLHNLPSFLISGFLVGYSFGSLQPSLQTMAMHKVSLERRGAASSTFFVSFDLGIALGCFIAGAIIKILGYDVAFCLFTLPCLMSLGYYYFFGRRHPSSFNPKK